MLFKHFEIIPQTERGKTSFWLHTFSHSQVIHIIALFNSGIALFIYKFPHIWACKNAQQYHKTSTRSYKKGMKGRKGAKQSKRKIQFGAASKFQQPDFYLWHHLCTMVPESTLMDNIITHSPQKPTRSCFSRNTRDLQLPQSLVGYTKHLELQKPNLTLVNIDTSPSSCLAVKQ